MKLCGYLLSFGLPSAALVVAACAAVGCPTQPGRLPRPTVNNLDMRLENPATMPTTAYKPTLPATFSPEPLDALFEAHEKIRQAGNILVQRLQQRLAPSAAEHVAMLHRFYGTGRFLRELRAWSSEDGGGLLTTAELAAIDELLERQCRWEALLVEVAQRGVIRTDLELSRVTAIQDGLSLPSSDRP